MKKFENWSENSSEIFLRQWTKYVSFSENIPPDEAEFIIHRILEATGCTEGTFSQSEANQLLRKLEHISWSRLSLTVLNALTVSISRSFDQCKHQLINNDDADNIQDTNEKLDNERASLTLLLVAKSLITQHWRNKPRVEARSSAWGTEDISGLTQSNLLTKLNCNQPTEEQQALDDSKNKEHIKSTLLQILAICSNVTPINWKNNVDKFSKYLLHISELIARISRFDFPQNWSKLSSTLTQFFKYQQTDTFYHTLGPCSFSHTLVLYYLVKEQSSKRLPTAVSETESLGADFLDISWKLWCCIDNILNVSLEENDHLISIHCQKIFRYVEKTMLLTACYFFRPTLVTSTTSQLPFHQRERIPIQVVQSIFRRFLSLINFLTEDFQVSEPHFTEIENSINFYILRRLTSMSKLLVTFTERQCITFAYAINEIQPVVEKLLKIKYSPQLTLLCEKSYYKVNKWISMCFRFLGLLLSNETETSKFQENNQMAEDNCLLQNYLLKVQQDVWGFLCFGIQLSLFEVENDSMMKWLKSTDVEDFGNFYLKGNEETVNALEFFVFSLSKCSYGPAAFEPQLTLEAEDVTDQFFKATFNVDELSEDHVLILQRLNIVMLCYLFLSTSWNIYSTAKSNFAQHRMMFPQCLYQHPAIELLRPASLDLFLANTNSNASFDLTETSHIINLTPNNLVLYFAYVARCIMFISTWAELVLLQLVPNETSSNDISVTTVIPILLLWSSVTSVPIPIRILSIYALNAAFDAFKDHPVWWFGCSQLPIKLQDPQMHGFSSLVRASLNEKSAMSDLFLSSAIDLLSVVKSPEAVSECLTLTSRILIAAVDPTSHADDERVEGCFSSLMSITSANDENHQCDLDDDTCRLQTPTREPQQRGLLLLSFIKSIWCNSSRITNITPVHSIVLDNLTFLIILQWRKYDLLISKDDDDDFEDASQNSKIQRRSEAQKACTHLPIGSIESAYITLQIFNSALDALAETTNCHVWLPYWCKIGNAFDEFLRLYLIYPTPLSFSSLTSESCAENNALLEESLLGYLELSSEIANTFLRLFKWITAVITKEQQQEELSFNFRLLDLQVWDICFECVCILVQSKLLATSSILQIQEEQKCVLKMIERELPLLSYYYDTEEILVNESCIRSSILPVFKIDFAPKLIDLIAAMITCTKLVDNHYETTNLGLRLLFHLTILQSPSIDLFLDAVIQELLCLTLCQQNIVNIVESHIAVEMTSTLIFSELESKRRYFVYAPDKAILSDFISACIIHKPILVRNALDRLLAMVLLNNQQPVQPESEEAVKAIVFGFILSILETTCPDSFPHTKASLIIASIDNIVAQIPLTAYTSQQPPLPTSPIRCFFLECCVAIIVLVFRQVTELEEAFTMHKQRKQQLRLSQLTPYSLPQFCSPATTRLFTTNSNRKRFRNSGVSSQYGRLAAFDQFISSPTPQVIIHKQFLPKSLRFKHNRNQCLTLSLEKRLKLDKELEELGYFKKLQEKDQSKTFVPYPKFLLYTFYVLSRWIVLIQNECASILEVVSQLLTPDESTTSKTIPSFKTLFPCSDTKKQRTSIQSVIYDELDIEAARKGLIMFESFFADYISLQ